MVTAGAKVMENREVLSTGAYPTPRTESPKGSERNAVQWQLPYLWLTGQWLSSF